MKKAVIIVSVLVLLQSCLEDDQSTFLSGDTKQKAAAKVDTLLYGIDGFNSGVTLALLSDSTFFYKVEGWGCMGGGREKYTFGSYKQHRNKIELLPEKSKLLLYDIETFDRSNPGILEYPYAEDTIRIKTEFFRVDINETSYLLSDEPKDEYYSEISESNDFQELASHLKDKEEPYGRYLTGRKTDNNVFNIEDLPEKWKNMFK